MFIRVAPGAATVEDAGNLRQLHVELTGTDDATPIQDAGLGTLDGDHAWLEIPVLRAAGEDTDAWRTEFDAMIAYARGKGWVNDTRVRAHVVRG